MWYIEVKGVPFHIAAKFPGAVVRNNRVFVPREPPAKVDGLPDFLHFYQKEAIRKSLGPRNFAFFMPVGSGKTLTAIYACKVWKPEGNMIVICPKALIPQWEETVRIYAPEYELEVFTYEWMAKNYEEIVNEYLGRSPVIIFDEASKLKNPETKRYAAAKEILKVAARAFFLTATPIENSLADAHALMSLAAPGVMSRSTFFSVYCITDWFGNIRKYREGAVERFMYRYSPYMYVMKEEEVNVDSRPELDIVYHTVPLTKEILSVGNICLLYTSPSPRDRG